ncbi:hypothetical protein [Rugosimonospora acidiphila]
MSTRLCFRLDEVLPVAEHAIASPTWRATSTHHHPADRGPALIWNPTDEQDLLTSNGLPDQHDDDGDLRAAPAWTWRHVPTGRRGRPHPGDADRFWPLNHHDPDSHSRPLIAQLREGAANGGHWLMVDADPRDLASPDRFLVLDHREQIAPPDTQWVHARVTAAAVWYATYPALVADGYSVRDGDVIARFALPTVRGMVADLRAIYRSEDRRNDPMPGETAALRLDGEVLTVSWSHDDGHTEQWTEIDRVYPDSDGHYAVGAYLWPWKPWPTPRQGGDRRGR